MLWFLLSLDWLIASVWCWRVAVFLRQRPLVPDLATNAWAAHPVSLPSLSVIVPARNEAAAITATLCSLAGSEGVLLEIIAVDDRSTDPTGALMDEFREAHFRCQPSRIGINVVHVTELPPGWLGKTHAMAKGVEQATGEWLLFTDGDILFRPDALRRALHFATVSAADHVVLFPTVLLHTQGERMMLALLQVLSMLVMRPWRVSDPTATRDYIGVGAFNLIRREVYDALGGWEALRLDVVEDVGLGRMVKQQGFAQRAAFGPDLVSVRWAEGAFGVVNNLTKNIFAFFRFRPERLLAGAMAVALFTLLPLVLCFLTRAAWWPMGVLLAAMLVAYHCAGRYHHFTAMQLLFYPIAGGLLIYAMLRSMLLALWTGGINWRGTFYPLSTLR